MGTGATTDDTPTLRYQTQERQRSRAPVPDNPRTDAECRVYHKLRRCGARRRTHTTLGDANGRSKMPRQATMDFVTHRRSHTRRLCQAKRPERIPKPLRSRTHASHRRLDSWHERHTPLHPKVQVSPRHIGRSRSLEHRARADSHTRTHSKTPARDRKLRTAPVVGSVDDVSRRQVFRHLSRRRRRGRRRCPSSRSSPYRQDHQAQVAHLQSP